MEVQAFLLCHSAVQTGKSFVHGIFDRIWPDPSEVSIISNRRLKDESERARYDCATYSKTEVSDLRQKFLIPFRDALSRQPV